MTNQTTVSLPRDQKDVIDEAQERLEAELGGITPTKGETVVRLCRYYVENSE